MTSVESKPIKLGWFGFWLMIGLALFGDTYVEYSPLIYTCNAEEESTIL